MVHDMWACVGFWATARPVPVQCTPRPPHTSLMKVTSATRDTFYVSKMKQCNKHELQHKNIFQRHSPPPWPSLLQDLHSTHYHEGWLPSAEDASPHGYKASNSVTKWTEPSFDYSLIKVVLMTIGGGLISSHT